MARLDQQRQDELEPRRIETTRNKLIELGHNVTEVNDKNIVFIANGVTVIFWPYSGWFSGKKPVGSGRGFGKLLKALTKETQ